MMNCQACGEAVGREDRVCPKCGAALRTKRLHEADPPDPMIGTLIDHKYRIEKRIGAGGMAVVYQARREIIGDLVALKIMNSQLLSDSNAVARFRREAQAAARLKHPNVVSIHDFGISDRFGSYIVMEYVTGESLKSLIEKEGPFTPQRAANIAKQICAALQEAHRQNIVHRDVKPDNIIVDRNSERCDSKVLDFGIASLRDAAATSLTQTGSVLGTPYYMSPEQCMGEELDGRSDIYSVGVILYQMLTGILPFNSPSASAVIVQHVSQQPVSLRQHNPAIPEAVEAVVLRAMQKKRGDRQQTARELVRELEEAVAASGAPDRPISAVPAAGVVANHAESLPTVHVSASEYPTGGRPPEPPSQASSKPASRKLLLAAALGGLVTVAILGAVYVPSLVTDPGSDEKSEVEKKVVPVDPPIKTPPEVA